MFSEKRRARRILPRTERAWLAALGGEELAGTGFEPETPEPGFCQPDLAAPPGDPRTRLAEE